MHIGQFFGDSYDIVKQSLIRWLRSFGDWSVHPMLTEKASEAQIARFEKFLGARTICPDVLTNNTDREKYFGCAEQCGNLFLDPDTGLCLQHHHRRSPKYLFARELVSLSGKRSQALTLVFDQSLPRGQENLAMEKKLQTLRGQGFYGFAYISHACFIIGGHSEGLVSRAFQVVVEESRLPKNRFVMPAR